MRIFKALREGHEFLEELNPLLQRHNQQHERLFALTRDRDARASSLTATEQATIDRQIAEARKLADRESSGIVRFAEALAQRHPRRFELNPPSGGPSLP